MRLKGKARADVESAAAIGVVSIFVKAPTPPFSLRNRFATAC
jgi:hypothetical protein